MGVTHHLSRPTRRSRASAAPASTVQSRPPLSRTPFVLAIALSAFLFFSLELLAARLVLPVFGGAPAVWTTSLCFFTAILLIGYAYAHIVATRLSPFTSGILQVAFAIAVIGLTLVAPSDIASLRMPGLAEAINVLLALLVTAGAAAVLLATTTPMLSAWYARQGGDPWWLYAASNGASFAALLVYPFLVEPFIGLSAQRKILVIALAAYAAIVTFIVRQARQGSLRQAAEPHEPRPHLGLRRRFVWLMAAAVPAGLLAATTNLLQTDLGAAPFLWVGPLGIYLASLVFAFSGWGRRALPTVERLMPVAATLLWVPFVHPGGWPPIALLIVELGGFLVVSIAIHSYLALDRPAASQLTHFYVILSSGGVLATAFVALLAPVVFSDIYEYPILLVTGLILLALMQGPDAGWLPAVRSDLRGTLMDLAWRLVPYEVVLIAVVVVTRMTSDQAATSKIERILLIGIVAVTLAATARITALITPIALVAALAATSPSASDIRQLRQERTFFGVIRVVTSGNTNAEYSGTTLHGLQFTDVRHTVPTTYYAVVGPLGSVFNDLRARTHGASIGVVGLGVGTIAAYAQSNDQLTFFEIDAAAARIAHDPAYFTFLRDAAVAPRIVPGDGRLSLKSTTAASFDLLVLDAFSSDAVPPHLLTREAIETYLRALRPGGVLAFNISNRNYNLTKALGATARSLGLGVAERGYVSDPAAYQQQAAIDSAWVVVGIPADVARFVAGGWTPALDSGPVLTDDYPDLTRVLWIFGAR